MERNNLNELIFKVNGEIFDEICVMKTAYLFLDKFYVLLDKEENYIVVKLAFKDSKIGNELTSDEVVGEFNNELLNQKIRGEISNETKNIRELILARALYSTYIDNPEISQDYKDNKENYSIETITRDWFEGGENG